MKICRAKLAGIPRFSIPGLFIPVLAITRECRQILILVAMLLSGCASIAPEPESDPGAAKAEAIELDASAQSEVASPPADESSPEQLEQPEPRRPHEYPVKPFDKETLYQLLAAEFAGYRGQYDLAMENYVEAAETTRDPTVAARATRLATYLKRDDAALKTAQIWAEVAPDNLDAHRHAVNQLMKARDLGKAITHLEAIKRLGGSANFDLFAYRAANLDRESRESLIAAMTEMLEDYPGDRQLMFSRAVLLEQNGRYAEAVEIADELLAEELDVNAIILKVNGLNQLDRGDEAVEFLASAVERMPNNKRLRLLYARHLFEADRLQDAAAQYRNILEQSPNDGDILFALALIAMEQGDDETTRDYLYQMIERDQRAGEAHFYLGRLAEKNGDMEAAVKAYRRAGEGYQFLAAQSRVASLMLEQGEVQKARNYLERLREDNPRRHDQLIQLEAQLLSEQGLKTDTFDLLDGALAVDPANIDLLYTRAMMGEKFDRLDILERDLRRIIELDPDNADALNALGYTLTDRTDRHKEALELIERALEIKPDEAAFIDSMGWVQFKLKNYEEAAKHLRRALEMLPNDEVAAHLGEVLWVMGEKNEANEVWEKALERTPDSEILKSVIDRLRDS